MKILLLVDNEKNNLQTTMQLKTTIGKTTNKYLDIISMWKKLLVL
jgi:hypothetical protein